jgi:acetate kinase
MAQGILVVNAGSSSVKFAVFTDGGQPEPKLLFLSTGQNLNCLI